MRAGLKLDPFIVGSESAGRLAGEHMGSNLSAGDGAWSSRDFLQYWTGEGENMLHHLHLWTAAEPLERCVLRLLPAQRESSLSGFLRFFNSRGELFHECALASHPGQLVQLPLEAFLGACETDGGMRHSYLEVVTTAPCEGELEIASSTRTCFIPALHRFSEREPRAFPIALSAQYRQLMVFVNPHEVQVSVKCRLYIGNRTPEEVCLIPPHGTVLLSPQVLFGSVLSEFDVDVNGARGASKEFQGYLRVTTRSTKPLGFQLLEERSFESGERVFGVVC